MIGSSCPDDSQVKFDQIASPSARMVKRNNGIEPARRPRKRTGRRALADSPTKARSRWLSKTLGVA